VSKIISERGDIITATFEMLGTMKENHGQLQANTLENLEERKKFLEICNLPRVHHEEIKKSE
jgi:hypothetical protein